MTIIRKSPGAFAVPGKLVDKWMLDMTGAEIKVMLALERNFQNKDEDASWSIENLKNATGLSQPAVSKAISLLIKKGFMEKRREGLEGKQRSIYSFNWWRKNED